MRDDQAYFEQQGPHNVIKNDLPIIPTLGKMVREVCLATKGYMATELVPTSQTNPDRMLEGLRNWP